MSRLITIDDLLGNAKGNKNKENEKCLVKIKGYDKEIELEKISTNDWGDILDSKEKDKDAELVYSACPLLRDTNLIETLGCKNNPLKVVREVFDNPTIFHLANLIMEFSGLKTGNAEDYIEKVVSDIKN